MRVCIINTFFPPWRGGAETHVYNLARNLSKFGHEVIVFCADDPLQPGTYQIEGVTVKRLKDFGWLYGVPLIPGLARELLNVKADIIHAHFPNPFNATLSALTAYIRGIPSILTWHNDLPYVTRMAGFLAGLHDYFLSPVYLGFFRKIIATSKIYALSSRILLRNIEKVRVIPNGVDCRLFNPEVEGERIRKIYNLEGGIVILFVAALTKWHKYKGLDFLLKAFKIVKKNFVNARLLIIGEGPLRRNYESLALSLGINEDALFVGEVGEKELPEFYAASDMVALPSLDRSEGFGLTLLEGNASGRPVIGSKVGGVPEVIEDGYNGFLVRPHDENALAKAIEKLCNDENLRIRMGKNGRNFAEQLDWGDVSKKIENLYFEVIKDSK